MHSAFEIQIPLIEWNVYCITENVVIFTFLSTSNSTLNSQEFGINVKVTQD